MLGQNVENFLMMMAAEKGASPNTLAAYRRDLTQFFTFSDINGEKDISKQSVELFLQDLHSQQFAPKSIARKLSAVKEFSLFRAYYCHESGTKCADTKTGKTVAEVFDRSGNSCLNRNGTSQKRLSMAPHSRDD